MGPNSPFEKPGLSTEYACRWWSFTAGRTGKAGRFPDRQPPSVLFQNGVSPAHQFRRGVAANVL